jgi:hypothetical protein
MSIVLNVLVRVLVVLPGVPRRKGFFMGWSRLHHKKSIKHPRHARVPLCVSHCEDCGNVLPETHQITHLESRCYACWSALSRLGVGAFSFDGSSSMASQ